VLSIMSGCKQGGLRLTYHHSSFDYLQE